MRWINRFFPSLSSQRLTSRQKQNLSAKSLLRVFHYRRYGIWVYLLILVAFTFIIHTFYSLHNEDKGGVFGSIVDLYSSKIINGEQDPDFKDLYSKFKYDTSLKYPRPYSLDDDLLTIQIGPDRGKVVTELDELSFYDSDPRLSWSVYLDSLLDKYKENGDTLPFSWYDWADFHDLNKLFSLKKTNLTCDFFFEVVFSKDKLHQVEEELGEPLFTFARENYEINAWYQKVLRLSDRKVFKVLGKHCKTDEELGIFTSDPAHRKFSLGFWVVDLFDKLRPEVYKLHARNYVLSTVGHPLSLTIMQSDKSSYQFYVEQKDRKNMLQSGMLKEFMNKRDRAGEGRTIDHLAYFQKFLDSEFASSHKVVVKELPEDEAQVFEKDLVYLKESDFEFNAVEKINELEQRKDQLSLHEKAYLESLKYSINTHPAFAPKYFQEPGGIVQFQNLGRHHDKRFFNGAFITDPYELQLRLNSLIRNFQKFTKANGLVSWLAHGTLYSYIYNGQTFPWDNDLDLQMPIRHLHLLAQYFNQSLILEDPSEGNGRYLVEIGSSITTRVNGNGRNNIDARFIDIDSGLYVDITGLSVSSALLSDKFRDYYTKKKDSVDEKNLHKNPNLIEGVTDLSLQDLNVKIANDAKYSTADKNFVKRLIDAETRTLSRSNSPQKQMSPEQRYNTNRQLGLYNCRNNHFVQFDMVSPLLNTFYHGVPVLVPNRQITLLKNEYKVPLKYGFITFKSNIFVPELRFWVTSAIMRSVMNKNGRNLDMEVISSPLNSLEFDEIKKLYKNMVVGEYSSTFSVLFNSLETSIYRLKELEIAYDDKMDTTEKLAQLHKLRTRVGTHLKATFKDPYLYEIEKRMWNDVLKEKGKKFVAKVERLVDKQMVEEMWKWTSQLHDKSLEMFQVKESEAGESAIIDFNEIGHPIFIAGELARNTIFQEDFIVKS